MGSIPSELSLNCGPGPSSEISIPMTIVTLLSEVSKTCNVSEKLLKLEDYVKRLEDEMRKIDAFKRELPFCMILITDAIMLLKTELIKYEKLNQKPVLEEFIPLKKSSDVDDLKRIDTKKEKDSRDKMNWMSSVQLWNHDQHSPKSDSNSKQIPKFDSKKITIGEENQDNLFKSCETVNVLPFKKCSNLLGNKVDEDDEELPRVPLLSLDTIGIKRTRDEVSYGDMNSKLVLQPVSNSMPSFQSELKSMSQIQTQSIRKHRRCWSPELHRRFVEALHKLGGCQVATPKQIRELMQVDGLTNDEVKSHLQKYRLHTRRVPSIPNNNNGESRKQSNSKSYSPQTPHNFCGDSIEDDEDERSESHSWKSHVIA